MNQNITIKQLTVNDWKLLKEIRIESVKAHPDVFAPSKDQSLLSDEEWKQRLSNPDSVSFVLLNKEGKAIGLTGVYMPDSETGHMVSTYINSNYKGMGLSSLLYEARIDWAKKHPTLKKLILGQRHSNDVIRKVHQKFGFKLVGSKEIMFGDGTKDKTEEYELLF